MKNARQGLSATLVGVSISIINAIIQYLMLYWVLSTYGTEFNGFIRVTTALTVLGGSTEGALGISAVVLLIKPLANDDFITANEIFSTARNRYHKSMISGSILVLLIAVLYPLEIVLAPSLISGNTNVNFNIALTQQNRNFLTVPFWQLMIIVLFFGLKNVFTAGLFGAYENVIQADQQNGVRRLIILFTDLVVYGLLFFLMNLTKTNGDPLNPLIPFCILMIYAPIRGLLIMMYVRRNYHWLKYYQDFNNFQLQRISFRMLITTAGQTALYNSDIILVMLVLGGYGLRTSSMLSLYLVIGVNMRLIMTNFITSFREYFVSVLVEDGRLYWEAYSKYELYLYAVSAFTFLVMSILSPYVVKALYGKVVSDDLSNLKNIIYYQKQLLNAGMTVNGSVANLNMQALQNAFDFMFNKPTFSVLYAATTSFILMIQGQFTLIQAKGRVEQVAKATDVIALLYIIIAFGGSLGFTIPQKGDNFIVNTLTYFYSVKIGALAVVYAYFWINNWQKGTYNSSLKHVGTNVLTLLAPVAIGILINYYAFDLIFPASVLDSIWQWIVMILIVIPVALGLVTVTSLSIRPKVALSLILMLPVVKQIIDKSKNKAKFNRLRDENIDVDKIPKSEKIYTSFSTKFNYDTDDFNSEKIAELDQVFKPKIYKLKANITDTNEG